MPLATHTEKKFFKVSNELYDPDREISKPTGESANGFTLLPTVKFKEREIRRKKKLKDKGKAGLTVQK